jgi:quercetin dioxygenase-like cupin family protein
MRRFSTIAILTVVTGLLAVSGAGATPSSGVALTVLAKAENIEPFAIEAKDGTDVVILTATIEPGGTTGWHSHPGPEIAVVKSGTLTVYDGHDPNCPSRTLNAGQGRVQHAKTVHLGKSNGSVPVELYATFVIPHGSPVRVDEPEPRQCTGR